MATININTKMRPLTFKDLVEKQKRMYSERSKKGRVKRKERLAREEEALAQVKAKH